MYAQKKKNCTVCTEDLINKQIFLEKNWVILKILMLISFIVILYILFSKVSWAWEWWWYEWWYGWWWWSYDTWYNPWWNPWYNPNWWEQ